MRILRSTLLITSLIVLLHVHAIESIILDTPIGKFEGIDNLDTYGFLGIRYAQPPIGENRWAVPKRMDNLRPGYYHNATTFGDKCLQAPSAFSTKGSISEDCLFLNIWVPKDFQEQKDINVLIFLHGGGFVIGSSMDEYIVPTKLVAKNQILVSLNYRLGIFGFLASHELLSEDPFAENFGLLDQRFAIHWVIENIKHFNGNPNGITLFGQSAGAMSTFFHLISNEDHLSLDEAIGDNVDKFMILSAPDVEYIKCDETEFILPFLSSTLNCPLTGTGANSFINCLRRVPGEEILSKLPSIFTTRKVFWHTYKEGAVPFSPCISVNPHSIFNKSIRDALKTSQFSNNNATVMLGTAVDEGTLFTFFTFLFHDKLTEETFKNMIIHSFQDDDEDDDAHKIFQHYLERLGTIESTAGLAEITNDAYFQCGNRRFANLLSPNEKTYKYLFNRHSEGSPIPQIKVFHALDLVYLFGTPIGGRLFPGYFNAEERELSDKMIAYFTNFAKYGKPTNDSIWPVYTRENPVTFVLDIGEPKTIVDYANFTCTFWDSIYPDGIPYLGLADEIFHESWQSFLLNELGFTILRNFKFIGIILLATAVLLTGSCCVYCCSKPKQKANPQVNNNKQKTA